MSLITEEKLKELRKTLETVRLSHWKLYSGGTLNEDDAAAYNAMMPQIEPMMDTLEALYKLNAAILEQETRNVTYIHKLEVVAGAAEAFNKKYHSWTDAPDFKVYSPLDEPLAALQEKSGD